VTGLSHTKKYQVDGSTVHQIMDGSTVHQKQKNKLERMDGSTVHKVKEIC